MSSKLDKLTAYWDNIPTRRSVQEDPMTNREFLWLEFSNLQQALTEAIRAEKSIRELIKESMP